MHVYLAAVCIDAVHRKVTYTQERHMFHVLIEGGLTYLCMAEEVRGRGGG